MKDIAVFTVILAAVAAATLAGIVRLEKPAEVTAVEAAGIVVHEEQSAEARQIKARLEEEFRKEKEKLEKKLEEDFDKRFKDRISEVDKLKTEMAEQKTELDAKASQIADLEEKVRTREEEARKKEEAASKKESVIEDLEKRLNAKEENLDKRRDEIEQLAQTLLRQQADIKASEDARRKAEEDLKKRESEVKDLAKSIEERQGNLERSQEKMNEEQKRISEAQEKNREEWKKIEEAYKRAASKEAEIEKKLKESSMSADEWAKVKEEWERIAEEKKKLDEAREVRENVDKFRETFDGARYASELSNLMRGVNLKTVESEFIPFEFFSATDQEAKSQPSLFGIIDVYLSGTKKYVVVSDYSSPSFPEPAEWKTGELGARFPEYSTVVLERKKTGFYLETLNRALGKIGGSASSAYVFGLITKVMMYEVYLHQKRVIEILKLDRKAVMKFKFAPFFHEGHWRFKVVAVTCSEADGRRTERKVGNYSF